MITHEVSPAPGTVRVTFSIPAAVWAAAIHRVGDFNDWNAHAHPLVQQEEQWSLTLDLEAGRAYRYRYLFNGSEWRTDCNADQYVLNPQCSYDSVVVT
jgi:1,4-alpha-glucan branching enzyme